MGGEGEADPVGRRSRSDARFVEAREGASPPSAGSAARRGREACGNINVAMAPEEEETVARAAARQSFTGVE